MSQKKELINKVDVFKTLDDSVKERLESIMEQRTVHEGEDFAVEGAQAFYFFILISGKIMLSTKEGKAVVFKESGDFIGFELLSSQGIYKTTLKSLSEGQVFFLDRSKFLAMIQEDSLMAESIMTEWESYFLKTAPFIEKPGSTGAESIY
ncbi:MAG: cyclic nucleotide-binding domain-containing protein [Desulfobacteraceae bacterium]|nr:cyclic nucleotide-binding domain-containing protein [Desulfobacteraceae bacterium]